MKRYDTILAYSTMAVIAVVLVILLTGCTSAAPERWLLYARANYLQGILEGKGTTMCADAARTASTADFCKAAGPILVEIKTVKPGIEAELAKKEPDWPTIMKYIDLVFTLAAKFIP